MAHRLRLVALLLLPVLLIGVAVTQAALRQHAVGASTCGASSSTPIFSYSVVHTYPHDSQAFTQGLVFDHGALYEGTGLEGRSTLRQVALDTGVATKSRALDNAYFGEGVTIFGERIIQLTWQSQVGFVYDKATFAQLGTFTYPTEGWGITHDVSRLIMSDGTATLYFRDPQTFAETGKVMVSDGGSQITNLNELEYIDGEVYANVWQTNCIARIDPHTGQVTAWIDLTGLLAATDRTQPVDVLNGIAYDTSHNRLFVTGKLWPKLFEIKLVVPDGRVVLPVVRST